MQVIYFFFLLLYLCWTGVQYVCFRTYRMTLEMLNSNINVHAYHKHTKACQKPRKKQKNHTPTQQMFRKQDKEQSVQHINPKPASQPTKPPVNHKLIKIARAETIHFSLSYYFFKTMQVRGGSYPQHFNIWEMSKKREKFRGFQFVRLDLVKSNLYMLASANQIPQV